MELLFKREQTSGRFGRVAFKLWAKIDLDEDEKALVKRYRFDEAALIHAVQPKLIRGTVFVFIVTLLIAISIFSLISSGWFFDVLSVMASIAAAYWYYHNNRETIYVRDLIHGRYFSCSTVIELARKEAWLTTVVSFLRQVMESAKNWDGTERHIIEPLPKEEARQIILKGV